jgi:hypothetical protein
LEVLEGNLTTATIINNNNNYKEVSIRLPLFPTTTNKCKIGWGSNQILLCLLTRKIVGRETKKRLEWKGKAIYLASMLLCSAAREKNGEDGIGRQVIWWIVNITN